MIDASLQAEVLNQALPYIQQFRGQTFVIKYGGNAMRDPAVLHGVIRNVLLLQLVGIRAVLIHGGGPEIDRWLERLGIAKRVENGLRVTDADTMAVVEMALARTNKQLVAEVQKAGGLAIGLSGRDGGLLTAEPISESLGRVGEVIGVDTRAIEMALDAGFVPIVCSVASDTQGESLNVNADSAAAALAGAIHAGKLILLTETDGVLAARQDPTSLISRLTPERARAMIADGSADAGMIPKLEAALHALDEGVPRVHFLNGGRPNSLLIEVFTDEGIGTMMERDRR
ncbi:MAG: acetylglutamate kinase [Fimbriimonadaceae bacterium]|nr:acetylglutamate kinase [Fimbriimonadaceae bacterium]